jgi:hypothetical protein
MKLLNLSFHANVDPTELLVEDLDLFSYATELRLPELQFLGSLIELLRAAQRAAFVRCPLGSKKVSAPSARALDRLPFAVHENLLSEPLKHVPLPLQFSSLSSGGISGCGRIVHGIMDV